MSALQNRRFTAITVAMCVGLGAAACSSSGGKASVANASAANPSVGNQSGGSAGVADAKPLDANVPVTVSIDCAPAADKPAQKAEYGDDLAAFKVKYPNVTINAKPILGQCDVPAQFTAMLKAHSETNAFYAYYTDKGQVLDSGDAAAITPYISDQSVPGFKDLLAGVLNNVKSGGQVYALPSTYYVTGLVYNRDLFTKAGLDPDKPPTSWDEVAADAAKISALGHGVTGYEDYSGGNTGGWHFTSELYSLGGTMVTPDGKKAAFNSPQGKAVLQRLYDMRWKGGGIGQTPVTQWADAFPPLAAGKVGMFVGAPDVIQRLVETLNANPKSFGLAPLPGASGAAAATLAGGDLFYFKKTDTPNQIKALIAWINFEYLTPGQGQFDYARDKALASSDKPVAIGYPQPYFWNNGTAASTQITSALKDNATLPVQYYASYINNPVPGTPEPPAAQQLYAVLDTAMSAVMTDKSANVDQLLADAETKANQILANQ
jgi:ABC-type glycerol-3-phosphate transport system substrate-binding protein